MKPLLTTLTRGLRVNDLLLGILLVQTCRDSHAHWRELHNCSQSLHLWLVVSCCLVVGARCSQLLLGAGPVDNFYCIIPSARVAMFSWPLVLIWACIGTFWTWKSNSFSASCSVQRRHLVSAMSLQVVMFMWLILYSWSVFVIWHRKRHLNWIKDNFRAIEDEEMRLRWGNVSENQDEVNLEKGLTAAEISDLPSGTVTIFHTGGHHEDLECPICLGALKSGDSVRQLDPCRHTYHRACIDLWLLRRADCPLCKKSVGKRVLWQAA